jgi:arylsulfatase A-like enzyme
VIEAPCSQVHGPLEVPKKYFEMYEEQGAGAASGANCTWARYQHDHGGKGFHCEGAAGQNCYCNRLVVKAQVSALDEAVANLTSALMRRGLWDTTVLVFQGDNVRTTYRARSVLADESKRAIALKQPAAASLLLHMGHTASAS